MFIETLYIPIDYFIKYVVVIRMMKTKESEKNVAEENKVEYVYPMLLITPIHMYVNLFLRMR